MKLKPVLYAEDEENDAFFLERAFQEVGIKHPLVVVSDGQEVTEYLSGQGGFADRAKHPLPCLALLDLNMPRKSGMQALEWIRKESSLPTLPVLILTSSLQDVDVDRAYAQGANGYLVKPSQPGELIKLTRAIHDFWLVQNRTTPRPEDEE